MGEKVSIVIVNYNLETETEECVESLVKGVRYTDYEIIIVDNGSSQSLTDTLVERIESTDELFLCRVEKNEGFGTGCNAGAEMASGSVTCFLNPDTRTISNFVSEMMLFLSRHPEIAVAGARSDDRRWLDFSAGFQPALWLELCSVLLLGRYLEGLLIAIRRRWRPRRGLKVGWVLGACLFIRASVFREVGGFDTEYFLYFEEVDLCRRVQQAGHCCFYYPLSYIYHKGSISGKRDYEQFTRRFYESKRRFFNKHYSSTYGHLMNLALTWQIASQMLFWRLMRPFNSEKAAAKLRGFAAVKGMG